MTTPTIEQMVDTINETFRQGFGLRTGLIAVLDKHVRGMLAQAHESGVRAGRSEIMMANHNDYADRILKSVKGE